MLDFEIRYSNERTAYINDANHFNGSNGYHQHTNTYYENKYPTRKDSPYTDSYKYYDYEYYSSAKG